MRVADVSPHALRALGAAAGVAMGVVAAKVASALPVRYEITHLTTGRALARRNVAVVLVTATCGAFLAHLATSVPSASIGRALFYCGINLTLVAMVVAAAAVDLEHMILPNELTLGGTLLALATSYFRAVGVTASVVGAVVGVALTYLPFLLYKKLRGRSGMGLGDAKLALLAGAWMGPEGALFVVFAGALQSTLGAVVMRVLGLSFAVPASVKAEIDALREKAAAGDPEAKALLADDPMAADLGGDEAADVGQGTAARADAAHTDLATMRLPMGPFLVLSCLEFLFARRAILALFDRFLGP